MHRSSTVSATLRRRSQVVICFLIASMPIAHLPGNHTELGCLVNLCLRLLRSTSRKLGWIVSHTGLFDDFVVRIQHYVSISKELIEHNIAISNAGTPERAGSYR